MTSQTISISIIEDCEKDHYVLYFESDDTYDVVHKTKCVDLDPEKNTVNVFYQRSKAYSEGKITYEGTKMKCDKKYKKYIKRQSVQISTAEGDLIHTTQIVNQKNAPKKLKLANDIKTEKIDNFDSKTRNKRPRAEISMCENGDVSNDASSKTENKCCSCESEYKKLKIDYENFRSEMNGHFDTLKTMISSLQNGQDLNAQYPSELWYNGINLLDFGASSIQKYVSKLMDQLYTEQEMTESYVIEGASTSKKKPLDLERLKKIRDAVYIKFRVANSKRNEHWQIVKERACRKCCDIAKKNRKNQS